MAQMQWKKLLSAHRLGCLKADSVQQGRSPFQQDFDRIVFSSAFRSLQDKAQVFPLADDAYLRTRLTHSMETASIGRSLGAIAGVGICKTLGPDSSLRPNHVGEIVAAAALAHDIGNPPLGHSGEDAIRYWFSHSPVAARLRQAMNREEIQDFANYEGNAQGFRVLARLQMPENRGGMQLTCATLGAFAKYPVSASASMRPSGVAGKKFNFFLEDQELFAEVAATTGMIPVGPHRDSFCRHPLAFLVEAADDITYRIVDYEDGHLLKLIEYGELENLFLKIINDNGDTADRLRNIPTAGRKVELLRAKALGTLVKQIAAAFLAHQEQLLNGTLEQPLIELIPAAGILDTIYRRSMESIYTYRRAIEIGLAGYELASGWMDCIAAMMEEYVAARKRGKAPDPRSWKTLHLLPHECWLPDDPRWLESTYFRLIRVLDCFSGMTDSRAVQLFKQMKGISLPGMVL